MESDNLVFKENGEIGKMKCIGSETKEKQKQSKDRLINIQIDYFWKKLFNNLERKKALNMVKFNKNIRERINININDYKEYLEKYSSIEIEIKPVNNIFGKFINFKEEDENNCHIYFNNNKKEIKRNYINKDEHIKIIKIIIDHQVESFEDLFLDCNCISIINFKKFNRNNINNMIGMYGNYVL